MLAFWIGVFVVSLATLVVGARRFTDSAERLGVLLGMSPFIIGVVIVGVGTSLPELISAFASVFKHSSEIVIGNVLGANIANILLILGISAIIDRRVQFMHDFIHIDTALLMGSAFLLALLSWDGNFSRADAILSLAGFAIYLLYAFSQRTSAMEMKEVKFIHGALTENRFGIRDAMTLLLGGAFMYLGANYAIESIVHLSGILRIPREIIAITAVSIGTTLPELTVSVGAAWKGKAEIAVGNILGSNIFNALVVMGLPGIFLSIAVPPTMISFGIPMMLVATILFFFVIQKNEITRWEGMMLILFYVFFIGKSLHIF